MSKDGVTVTVVPYEAPEADIAVITYQDMSVCVGSTAANTSSTLSASPTTAWTSKSQLRANPSGKGTWHERGVRR